jgi:hypothetical protein
MNLSSPWVAGSVPTGTSGNFWAARLTGGLFYCPWKALFFFICANICAYPKGSARKFLIQNDFQFGREAAMQLGMNA